MLPWIKLKSSLSKVRSNLTSLGDQPLGKAALIVIIFLDIFILVSIFDGLDAHTRQLSSPDVFIPGSCREIVVNQGWNNTNKIDNISRIIIASSTNQYRVEEKKHDLHPVCVPYVDLVDLIKKDKVLTGLFEERNKANTESHELQREIDRLKGSYDTSLLETIAQKKDSQTKVAATKEDFLQKTASLDSLKSKIALLEQSINNDEKIKELWGKIQGLQESDRQRLLSDLRTLNFWFPVKKLGMQLIFLVPLFFIFYAWNSASVRKCRGVQTLVSTHLLGVAFIPILCKIIETVYYIIPKKFLKQFIALLESLKLVALWHYIIIALAIGVALALIFFIQKKLFSSERIAKIIERRISLGACQQCGKHLPIGAAVCPFCGFAQYKECNQCHGKAHVHGKYCQECGHTTNDAVSNAS